MALAGGLLKGFSAKKLSNNVNDFKDCLVANLYRMFFCGFIGFLSIGFDLSLLKISSKEVGVFIISSASMVAFCVTYMFAYKLSAYMYLSLFGMLGSILTCLLSFFIYKEKITLNKWIGIGIILIAVLIMSKYNKDIKGISIKGIIILIFAAISVALSDFSQKIYSKEIGGSARSFNFYTYFFGCIIIMLFLLKNTGVTIRKIKNYEIKNIFICILISAGLYINTLSKTTATNYMSSAEIYPVLQGANLIASAILAQILLKEKINVNSVCGMLCAFIGLMIMYLK